MHIIVTGSAGFIGSATVAALLDRGHSVVGIDSLTDYYDVGQKRANIANLVEDERAQHHQIDLTTELFDHVFSGADAIVHLAGQPGVRHSWAAFDVYTARNVAATKAVLDAALRHQVRRVVYASSSSVYGDTEQGRMLENGPCRPLSPYAVTKLAGEHLVGAYAHEHDLDTIALRYFTVYGPSQRPDMLMHRLIEGCLNNTPVSIFGDGEQRRDFTFVNDIAMANVRAVEAATLRATVCNVSGGSDASVNDVIRQVHEATGTEPTVVYERKALGDVRRTAGDSSKAREILGWTPTVELADGIAQQVHWHRSRFAATGPSGTLN